MESKCAICWMINAIIAIFTTWILGIAIVSWMINIRNAETWLLPYRAYTKVLWRDIAPINEVFYSM